MKTVRLDDVYPDERERAGESKVGRSALTLKGGGGQTLGQVLLTMNAGSQLADHNNPGEATLLVLSGEVTLGWADGSARLKAGEYTVIPQTKHRLDAHADSVVLLSVARTG
ncbi:MULTISPECIES: cupin domain-containing protein [Yimella]|uniref:Quercetin dioxygenase-like cupin family protein n=1 Tax=Yimella lutea TaxID=587872 RepID=A0A542EGA0_9MICO|nr:MULTISPECIES: cupin domain-containing protein [Yimella]MCG8655480.1 cupin domain-containing protein [Yimella sp. NH-Cas1]TQJ14339.1 quercetin dioxygenase-like cupin family protein [Yimella lutea]